MPPALTHRSAALCQPSNGWAWQQRFAEAGSDGLLRDKRHPKWTFHFTPISGSWFVAAENFFSVLTRKRIRRATFQYLAPFKAAIKRYQAEHNKHPKPFVWTASAASILAKLKR